MLIELLLAATLTRPHLRDLGVNLGTLPPGPLDAITDVGGVRVGQTTLIKGDNVRTGVTAILPHGGNLFRDKVPGAIFVGNGFGKLMGYTQVEELGEIESPIMLTSTLNVPRVGRDEVFAAIKNAKEGPVEEGAVGAGTGTIAFGWKGGIGTSSRKAGNYTVGVLVQTNFGGFLQIGGVPIGNASSTATAKGSCMIVVATDAPVDSRNLKRMADDHAR